MFARRYHRNPGIVTLLDADANIPRSVTAERARGAAIDCSDESGQKSTIGR